jgi:hypothetical protein
MKELLCYHGTSQENWNKIRKEGRFRKTANGWFGTGVYFYLGNPDMAIFWCRKRYPDKKKAVLRILLSFDEDEILDIRDPNSKDSRLCYRELNNYTTQLENKIVDVRGKQSKLDSIILDYMCKKYHKKAIIANSITLNKYFTRIPNGTEVCVIDENLIPMEELEEI